ncbi:hypothetical protein HDU98_001552 [Podochytrium sp. JEL0797]|nr:hypothetical protein HDU98_001552 [Podochytrium sp. JEL0797]
MTSRDSLQPLHILICATGSVASVKIPLLVSQLQTLFPSASLKVVATKPALAFFASSDLPVPILTDNDEWTTWNTSKQVLHIDLRNWASVAIVAPLDANTLAKLANGLCDNLLTCVLRAWDPAKPVLVAPAMNTQMWNHPLTKPHIDTVTNLLGYTVIPPIEKLLACGDCGIGAMAEVAEIVSIVQGVVEKLPNANKTQQSSYS